MTLRTFAVVAILALAAASPVAAGPEPWTDPTLPIRDGLELWLDASRATDPLPTDRQLGLWRDGSGHRRDLRQELPAARPEVVRIGGKAVVRFDGANTHLRGEAPNTEVGVFHIFVVVAPRQNPAPFRGLLAFNSPGQRDYESGLTLDLGASATPRFSALNVEGRGFGGARNLRTGTTPFGRLHTLDVAADTKAVRLAVDGTAEGSRPRTAGAVSLAEITLGARYYNNGPGPQRVEGPSRCDIAEVIVYGRALAADEVAKVRAYLSTKYAHLRDALPPESDGPGEVLVPVADPPPVQVFLPGFSVRQLPLDLTNINNVKYRADGALVALAYNGDIWVLKDTDGDGLEDTATLFWENKGRLRAPIGMDLTPPGYRHGTGVFVACKGKCTLIVDTDGDGKADKEIVVAGGWPEPNHNVDTLGVAIDPTDGSVYFGRGTPDYTNAYVLDKDGKSGYKITGERGTIQRVSPDFTSREIVATGIRYPVGLRFNRHKDLFATDQEGATWLPNGNPLDELLHIQKGRHYGFPPRHPKHLPNVIDEPSTYDYGPQHQSTCGLNFNEPMKPGGPTIGPAGWAGDAFVAGYSRGKLYRTQLVKTDAGYVARNHLFACLNMLTVDACVAPDGGLVVACHSGGPDWGSGPTGKGKLFKIAYTDRAHPQPVLVWPAGPREIRVEFDRPVDPELLRNVLAGTKLTAGPYVRAGDRFESLWPGYAVVGMQKAAPRTDVPVRSAQLTPDRRTLVLATDPHPAAVHFALTLPGMGRPATKPGQPGALPQHPAIDLDFDLSGCEATLAPADGKPPQVVWLPHLDLQVARALTVGSAPHDAFWKAIKQSGTLTIKTQLDLVDMLRPAVQPGSRLDYELPAETVNLNYETSFVAGYEGKVTAPSTVRVVEVVDGGFVFGSMAFTPTRGKPVAIEFRLMSSVLGLDGLPLPVTYSTHEDKRPRPLPLHRALVPWADGSGKSVASVATITRPPELTGGSWARGRKEFYGDQAACGKCHTVQGLGGEIGPDLSNLIHRDYASVYRDITRPSFAINPDHLTYAVSLKDGRSLTGVVRTVGDKIRIGDTKGAVTEVGRDQVETMRPTALSTMPEDLLKPLGPDRTRDLMTFLLTPPPSMPRDYPGPRPKPRPVAEVQAALAGAPSPPEKTRPIRVVLVAGPKDHGPGEHDYPAWQKAWSELLSAADPITVTTAWEWPAKEEFQKADVMVFYQHGDFDAARAADVDAFLERGGGLVYAHWAIDGRKGGPEFAKRIGLAGTGSVGFRHGPVGLSFDPKRKHPVTRNFEKLALVDETYWKMVGDLPPGRVLGSAVEDGQPQPQLWSLEQGRGRVFVSIPGHYSWTFDDPLFRLLFLRGIAWAAKEPVDRFNDLIWPGADVAR